MDDSNLRSSLEQFPSTDTDSLTLSLDDIRENIQRLRDQITASLPSNQLTFQQIEVILEALPRLTEDQVMESGNEDSLCSICLNPFLAILAEEEMAIAMDSPAHPIEALGVTRLSQPWQCGHIFCRRDISKWVQEGHASCPMCRTLLVKPSGDSETPVPPSEPDTESAFGDLEHQISYHLELLRGRLPDISGAIPSGMYHALSHSRDETDRSAYSGMYS